MPEDFLVGRIVARNMVDADTGEIVAKANDELTESLLKKLRVAGIKEIQALYTNELDEGAYISQTLATDETADQLAARVAIYRMMRPGEPPTEDAVEALFHRLFYSADTYDLSRVGRMKFNARVGRDSRRRRDDAVATRTSSTSSRSSSSCATAAARSTTSTTSATAACAASASWPRTSTARGLARIEKAVKERLGQAETEALMPHDLINSKPISAALKEFFGASQLSQFMDQTNPLSEITHKRRVSALGPGGLTRERAGFEVRDVHPTHYGRVCPIETPEGPNIGLINSLALYAQLNEYGFLETPYRRVADGKVTNQIDYLSAIEEGKYVIAQANATLDADGKLIDELVSRARERRIGADLARAHPVHGRRADADRVGGRLAGAVPRARRREPRADGRQHAAPGGADAAPREGASSAPASSASPRRTRARSSPPRRGGVVDYVDTNRIVIRVNDNETVAGEVGVDIYNLIKYQRCNQNTNIHQRPIVKRGDKVEARGHHRRRRLHRPRRAGARPEHAGRVHALERLQLRGLDPDQRTRRRRRPLHLDPHRGAGGHGARHQAGRRGNHARHPEPVASSSSRGSTSRASSTSAPR